MVKNRIIMVIITILLVTTHQQAGSELAKLAATKAAPLVNGATSKQLPPVEKVENFLIRTELTAGLGNLIEAVAIFEELMLFIGADLEQVTSYQQARINTMSELLSDMLAN